MSKPKNGSLIGLPHELVRSEVWIALSANAFKLLIGIWDQHNGHNNGELRFGQKQAMRILRCSPRTAVRVFAELQDAGLIVCTEKGSFAHKDRTRDGKESAWRITAIRPTGKPNGKPTASRSPDSFDGVSHDP